MTSLRPSMTLLRGRAEGHHRLIFLVSGCEAIPPYSLECAPAVRALAFVDNQCVGRAVVEVVNGNWLDAMCRAKSRAVGLWEERQRRRYEALQGLCRARLHIFWD